MNEALIAKIIYDLSVFSFVKIFETLSPRKFSC